MTRYKASGLHLLLSATAVAIVLSLVFLVWYPQGTFYVAGAWSIVLMLVGVDLVLGPTLTLIVYKEGKPGLKFDLAIIIAVQALAMVYGSVTLFQERPAFLVFAIDRFNMVAERHVDLDAANFEEFNNRQGQIVNAYARRPDDGEPFQAYLQSVLFEGQPDLEERPEFWEPYENGRETILAVALSVNELSELTPKERKLIKMAMRKHADRDSLGFIPIASARTDVAMLIDMETAEPVEILPINAWVEPPPIMEDGTSESLAEIVEPE